MAKTIFEEMGGKYERQGDYLIPCLTVPAEEENGLEWTRRMNNIRACAMELVNEEIIYN